MPDFPCVLRLLQRAHRFFDRDLVIDRVQLIEIDPVEFQPLETFIYALRQALGPTVWHPLSRAGAGIAALGRDDQSFGIRMQRFRNQELVRFRPVSVGRVDQIHSELDCASQNLFCVLAIGRPTPNPGARQAHRAKAEPINRKISAYGKRFVHARSRFRRCHH